MPHIPGNFPNLHFLAKIPEPREVFEPAQRWLFQDEDSIQGQHNHHEEARPDSWVTRECIK